MCTDGEMFRGIRNSFKEKRTFDETIADWLKVGSFMPIAPFFDALIGMYAKIT